MLNEMRLYVIADEKDSKIQLYENHDIIITSFISMNNLYFFNVVENPFMRVNIIIKKSNYRQRQNAVRFIMIWHHWLSHLNIADVKNIQRIMTKFRFHKLTEDEQKAEPVCQTYIQEK